MTVVRRRLGGVLVVVAWGCAPRVPPNIADSREIRIRGLFLTPTRFPHRRNRDSGGCFHNRVRTFPCPELFAASPAGTHEPAGWPPAYQIYRPVRATACWLLAAAGASCLWQFNAAWPGAPPSSAVNTISGLGQDHQPLGDIPRHRRALPGWRARMYRPAGRGTYEVPAGHLGCLTWQSRRQTANWTCSAQRHCQPAGASSQATDAACSLGPVPAGHVWGHAAGRDTAIRIRKGEKAHRRPW